MMAWNPNQYNQFKTERFAPFYDLLQLIEVKSEMQIIDLGCGTGELTSKLAEFLPDSSVWGIDSSAEMLNQSVALTNARLHFKSSTIEDQLNNPQKWDLIFSNAAIQWVDDHQKLLPKMIAALEPKGQLVIQIPSQNENRLNKILLELVAETPYREALNNWSRISPVLTTEAYAQILFENGGKAITVYEKIYPLIVSSSAALYDWIAGTALIPYVEKMDQTTKIELITEFKRRIETAFAKSPTLYPFKRILMAAKF